MRIYSSTQVAHGLIAPHWDVFFLIDIHKYLPAYLISFITKVSLYPLYPMSVPTSHFPIFVKNTALC